jgi:arylsulfatase A-like enzyme
MNTGRTNLSRRALIAGGLAPGILKAAARPNLVLFLSDDHGYWDSTVYGCRAVRTPNLAALAASGLTFDNAFSGAAICIPSRAILASGLCSHRNGAIANGRQMKPGIKTLPSYLSELGYRVAHFGKSHFLPESNYKDWEAVPSEIRRTGPLNHDLDTEALDRFLAGRGNGTRPLCLVVCSHSPHVIWDQNESYDPAKTELPPSFVDTPATRTARANYYTDITKMDTQLGAAYASVRKHLGANTLFLYTSDNGAQWPFGKWNLYDAGIRLPMIASWPGVVAAGKRTPAMVSFTDFLPTFMELAGGRPPDGIDGRSFASVLRGKTRQHRQEIYASHTADNNSQMNCYPMRAARTSRFKYIRNLYPELTYHTHIDRALGRDGKDAWDSWVAKAASDPAAAAAVRRYHQRPPEELYDVVADPHEMRNLAGQARHEKTLGELRAKVDAWMRGMDDKGEIFGVPRPLSQFRMPV